MSERLHHCRTCHWWTPIEHVGDTGQCRRFPPTVVPDFVPENIKMMGGNEKTVIRAGTSHRYGVFPTTPGSAWCGEWAVRCVQDVEELRAEEEKARKQFEQFAKDHPGELFDDVPVV